MSRPRKPTALLELSGAFKKDPQRARARANEPRQDAPIGSPPERLTEIQAEAWAEIVDNAPAGVLAKADRWLVEICACIMAQKWQFGVANKINVQGISNGELTVLTQGLSRMGFTPADRSKISVPPDEKAANPFEELASEVVAEPEVKGRRVN